MLEAAQRSRRRLVVCPPRQSPRTLSRRDPARPTPERLRPGKGPSVILGIDTAIATCGWSVVDPRSCAIVDFGVIETSRDARADKSTDFGRRSAIVSAALKSTIAAHGVRRIAAEQALLYGATNAVVSQVVTAGALVGLSVALDLELVEVVAVEWQRAVLGLDPKAKGKVPYERVVSELELLAGSRLLRLPKPLRTHALDAIGVGAFAALRPATKVVG